AGTPLRLTPPGALALALVEAMAQGFSPVALLAVLKHPLAASGDGRLVRHPSVRLHDMAPRGVRPPPGLDAIGEALDRWQGDTQGRARRHGADPAARTALATAQAAQRQWWDGAAAMLEPLALPADHRATTLPALAAALRLAGTALAGDRLWSGNDGRALAGLIDRLEAEGGSFGSFDRGEAPTLIAALLSDIAVRAAYGGHPRLAILGPLEAQLQRADLMILGGLNEGVWPGKPAPDPWLAPAIRGRLGLPGLARATGLAAHDFVGGMGAASVLLTRARRDASAPLVASRFWLRIQGFSGGIDADAELLGIARAIDGRGQPQAFPPPRPCPPVARRPKTLSVTEIDTLIADPFAFYARNMLRLKKLDPLDDDPTAATRGNRIHAALERWVAGGIGSLELLEQLGEEEIGAESRQFPLLRALWAPRARRALRWAGAAVHDREAAGWQQMVAEAGGEMQLSNGVSLRGRADRIDRDAEGRLAVIDYKTGRAPSGAQVRAGFANQLGLLMAMAAAGHLRGKTAAVAAGTPHELAYWKLIGGRIEGEIKNVLSGNPPLPAADHAADVVARAEHHTSALLCAEAVFAAKLYPGLAWNDYDHLARVAEWLDRPDRLEKPR
ncbi:MAG: PD-(D/E)XK nuclease family protein, partial [Sandarakinorhabdus sp.]|nr:PD-(D/E)XK nuclease family protein [Sandarakinorhabdus sp.]